MEKERYSRKRYGKLAGAVLLIVASSLTGAWLLITGVSYTLSFVLLVVILLITLWIIRSVRASDRRLTLFFDSLESGDVSLHYPAPASDPFLLALSARMIGYHLPSPFYTTKPGGSGIGLSISRRIMQLHGGRLTVPVPGEKTVFSLEF